MSIKQYDVSLSDNTNTSDWKILHHIQPNSTVLEFGPAYGRMTKYMKETLGCKVYIVEIDPEAYENAMQYAVKGVCGNILDFLWIKEFDGIAFDYIIFADVLEHLLNPAKVLDKSVSFLKEDGSVLLSVPNIAHGAVVIDLINNKFEYRKYGLLDKTHIRFFTYSSLIELLENCSLVPTIEDGVVILPEGTEFKNSYYDLAGSAEIFENREYTNIYQFIFKCIKKRYYAEYKDDIVVQKLHSDAHTSSCNIYFDTGADFNSGEVGAFPLYKRGSRFEVSVSLAAGVKRVRFDPLEGYACIIGNLQIVTDAGTVEYAYTNGMEVEGVIVFDTLDPQIAVDFHGWPVSRVKISGDIYRFNFDDISLLSNCRRIFDQNTRAEHTIQELVTERDSLTAERNSLAVRYPELTAQNCCLYFDTGDGYHENGKQDFSFTGNEVEISCQVPENTVTVRLDPVEGYGCVISNPEIFSYNGIVKYESINGYKMDNGDMVFANADPQIKLYGAAYWLKIKYRILCLSDFSYYKVLDNYIVVCREQDSLIAERDGLVTERDSLAVERDGLVLERNDLIAERDDLVFSRDEFAAERDGLAAERNGLAAERDSLTVERDGLATERDGLVAERNGLAAERDSLVAERDGLAAERDSLTIERDGLVAERNGLAVERDSLTVERDGLAAERDGLAAERDGLVAERNGLAAERDSLTIERDGLVTERDGLATKCPEFVTQCCNIYFDTGNGYSENEKLEYSFIGNEVEISCQIPENTVYVRLDPVEGYGCVISNMEIVSCDGDIIKYEPINGFINKRGDMVFTHTDPQIKLQGVGSWFKFKIKYRILVYKLFDNSMIISQERDRLMMERDSLMAERDGLIASRSWRFTKSLREIGTFIRRNKPLYLCVKGILSLKRNGIKKTIKKIVDYNNYKRRQLLPQLSPLDNDTFLYESEYQENIDFSGYEPKVKTIAFYLPQFHRIPENDKWWGNGFTEWTNTRKAKPRFNGHYQPREPHKDIGYYDLTNVETLKKQAALAKQHGIYGFCFYLYWFSGKRLLEKPLDLFLEHPEIDINFCLCWANENWTRRWDGLDNKVLIKQDYSEGDPFKFIEDIQKYVVDKRYIRIDGIPIILVYYPGHIPNVRDVFLKWREYANEIGIGKINIFICNTWGHTAKTLNIEDIIDGSVEFPPHNMQHKGIYYESDVATIADYDELMSGIKKELLRDNNSSKSKIIPLYRTSVMGWDNTARKEKDWFVYGKFSLRCFYEWISLLVADAQHTKKTFIFVNAWNEWGEGTYLEPDKKYGYANINTLSKAICELPFKDEYSQDLLEQLHKNRKH